MIFFRCMFLLVFFVLKFVLIFLWFYRIEDFLNDVGFLYFMFIVIRCYENLDYGKLDNIDVVYIKVCICFVGIFSFVG